MAIIADEFSSLIDDKLAEENLPIEEARAWHQLQGLVDHIHTLTNALFTELKEINEGRIEGRESRIKVDYTVRIVDYLVACFLRYAMVYFDEMAKALNNSDLSERKKVYFRYQAIRKLTDEWAQISPLLTSAKDPNVKFLEELIRAADPELERIKTSHEILQTAKSDAPVLKTRNEPQFITIPFYGRRFELNTFLFAPDLHLLGLPYIEFNTPWSWLIIWHEMAGRMTQILRKTERWPEIVDNVERTLLALQSEGKLPSNTWQTWLDSGEDEEAQGIDRDQWVTEIMEDAYATYCLGPDMLNALRFSLQEHYQADDDILDREHPPIRLRLLMSAAALALIGADFSDFDEATDEFRTDAEALRPVVGEFLHEIEKSADGRIFNEIKDRVNDIMSDADRTSVVTHDEFRPMLIAFWRRFHKEPGLFKNIVQEAKSILETLIPSKRHDKLPPLELPTVDDYRDLFQKIATSETPWLDLLAAQAIFSDGLTTLHGHFHSPPDQGVPLTVHAHTHTRHTIYHRHKNGRVQWSKNGTFWF